MREKAMGLILLVVFAAATTSFALGIASIQPARENVDVSKPYSLVPVEENQTRVGPDGLEIDNPGMPH